MCGHWDFPPRVPGGGYSAVLPCLIDFAALRDFARPRVSARRCESLECVPQTSHQSPDGGSLAVVPLGRRKDRVLLGHPRST